MLFAIALAAATAIAPSASCSGVDLRPGLKAAAAALSRKDLEAAQAAIAPAAACPVADGVTYAAHVLRADIAVREGDWTTARTMLAGVAVHPEAGLSARAGFIRLRADQGLGDAAAFAADRAALLSADDARLSAIGRRVETFRIGFAQVAAYEAALDQGAFHRTLEFIVTPDDPAAYPSSILLTDDRGAIGIEQATAKPGAPKPEHAWFIDLYTCARQATLSPPAQPFGPAPAYADVRARVSATLSDASLTRAALPPDRLSCPTAMWILPGLGHP